LLEEFFGLIPTPRVSDIDAQAVHPDGIYRPTRVMEEIGSVAALVLDTIGGLD
jgi:hypothetical protein